MAVTVALSFTCPGTQVSFWFHSNAGLREEMRHLVTKLERWPCLRETHCLAGCKHFYLSSISLSAACAPRPEHTRRKSWALSPSPASSYTLTVELKENPALLPLLSHFEAIITSSTLSCELRPGGSMPPSEAQV